MSASKLTRYMLSKKLAGFLGVFLAIFVSFALYYFRQEIIVFSQLGYLGLFVTSMLTNATVFIPIPYIPVVAVAATILNPFFVALCAGVGSAIGELTGFLAGASGKAFVSDNQRFKKIEVYMSKYGMWTIFFLSFVPNFIIDVAGIVCGATKVPVYKFLVATAAGKFARYLVICYATYFGFQLT